VREVFRVRLDLAYVGGEFHGWQIQPDARTVQGEIKESLTRLLGREVVPVAAGRTDAGVNARGQVAHLTVASAEEVQRVARALPAMMPADIHIHRVCRVSPSFNARVSATARRYSYRILMERNIFDPLAWYIYRPLDRQAMTGAAEAFAGSHDFTSFCKAKSLKEDHNLCHLSHCAFDWRDDSAIFHVRANRFLHHMVRNMVGTLVEIGRGERATDDIPRVLAARSRSACGRMAPPQGLFLEEVYYPEQLLDPGYVDPDHTDFTAESDLPPEGDKP
jgi:tRNA pseudouridine38-40 synthase